MARIARAAGVNKQLIFYYFDSKDGLYDQVASDAASEVAAPGRVGPFEESAQGRLRSAVSQLHELFSDKPEVVAVLVDRARRAGSPDAARAIVRDILARVRDAVSSGQGLGYFRDDVDPDEAAVLALSLCLGHAALRDLLPEDTASDDAWRGAAGDLLARGLAW